MRKKMAILGVLLSAVLAGCGGGGGDSNRTACSPTMANPNPCPPVTAALVPSTNPAASIKFVSAETTNIALKGTGGFGRQEHSTLKFEVFDNAGVPVVGAPVEFSFSDSNTAQTVGGLTLLPAIAISDSSGAITTVVSAGTIPTSVRVVATVRASSPQITTLSNILVISTGVPDQLHFTLNAGPMKCDESGSDGCTSLIEVVMGDHFGNPVPDGTAVNFTTEGGIIDASCVTGSLLDPPPDGLSAGSMPTGQTTNSKIGPRSGSCRVVLRKSNPWPTNGQVTVLAYALGEEDFFDVNGNNVCDNCSDTFGPEFKLENDKSPDIFRDDNDDRTWSPGEPCIGPNHNGSCSTLGDGKYNGVLRNPLENTAQTLYVWDKRVIIFP